MNLYTPDSGLTDTYSTLADGRVALSFVCSRMTAPVVYRHVIPLQTVWST